MALTNDASKSGSVAAIDTVLKTLFYYIHESCYEKAEKRKWKLCYEEQNNETPPPNLEMTRQTSEV